MVRAGIFGPSALDVVPQMALGAALHGHAAANRPANIVRLRIPGPLIP